MKPNRIVIVLVLILGLFSDAYAGDNFVTIGVSLGLTGKYAPMGDMQRKAYLLWEESINRTGGLLGKKVKMIIEDDKSDKLFAREIYKRFFVKDKVDLVMAPYSSPLTGAIMPLAEEYGYPVLAPGASADQMWKKGYKYLFGVQIPASRYAVGFLEMLALGGIEDIAVVYADDIFSSSAGEGTKKWGEDFGLNVKLFEIFKKGATDLTGIAEKVKSKNVQAMVLCAHYTESVNMIKAFEKINWRPDNFFATVGPAQNEFGETLKEAAEGVFSSSQWEPALRYQYGDHEVFLNPFKKKYGITPSYQAGMAFAACQILSAAVTRVNSFDRNKIRDALANMDTVSIVGRYGVDENGVQIKHFPINIQWQNGKKEIVWPSSVATAEPILR